MCDPSSKLLNFGSFVACFVRHQHREKEWKKKVAGARRQSVFGARTTGMGHVLTGNNSDETLEGEKASSSTGMGGEEFDSSSSSLK